MKTKKKKIFTLKRVLISLSIFLTVSIIGFGIYVSIHYEASAFAKEYVKETDITIEESNKYIVCGDKDVAKIGYIFYPGAKVDAQAYLPYMIDIVKESDVLCVVVKPLFRLAILDQNLSNRVIESFPEVEHWAIGGHSLGGVVATAYAKDNSKIDGLLLLASYPNNDISKAKFPVLSITASKDTVINMSKYHNAKDMLPKTTIFKNIDGGNHGQFGSYGHQNGDSNATISEEKQRQQVVLLTVGFLRQLEN